MIHRFFLSNRYAFGDVIAMSALVRDIKLAYGSSIEIDVDTSAPAVWLNNPWLTPLKGRSDVQRVELYYKATIEASRQAASRGLKGPHMIQAYHLEFERRTGFHVPLTLAEPDLHLTSDDHGIINYSARTYVIMAGGKNDITTKLWPHENYRKVVQRLADHGITCLQAGLKHPNHIHQPIPEAINFIDQTGSMNDIRPFIRLIRDSAGVIAPVTAAMHIAAALAKPAVIIGGGREDPSWIAYDAKLADFKDAKPPRRPHKYLHTVSKLDCCQNGGCWQQFVVPEEIRVPNEASRVCTRPVRGQGRPIAECMMMITPEQVVEAVLEYDRERIPS